MPSSTLIPFLGGLGSLINPLKQKRVPLLSLGYWASGRSGVLAAQEQSVDPDSPGPSHHREV